MSSAWRMRLIGSLSPLPAPRTQEVNSNFQTKEIRDYYVPNPKSIMFRSVSLTGLRYFSALFVWLCSAVVCLLVFVCKNVTYGTECRFVKNTEKGIITNFVEFLSLFL